MKSVKFKLISSIFCLVAAVALAAFTVYAWFITNSTARTNGIQSVITSGDVVKFELNYYKATTNDGKTYTKGDQITETGGQYLMDDYTPRLAGSQGSITAVIIEMVIEFSDNPSSDSYSISASLTHNDLFDTEQSDSGQTNADKFKNFTENNYLSNAVTLKPLTTSDNTSFNYNTSTVFSFVGDVFNDTSINDKAHLTKIENIKSISSPENQSVYFVMDYDASYINAIYTYMLQQFPDDATLNTRIDFTPDIIFAINASN